MSEQRGLRIDTPSQRVEHDHRSSLLNRQSKRKQGRINRLGTHAYSVLLRCGNNGFSKPGTLEACVPRRLIRP
ncbi:MAG: hypothetical protein U0Z53_08805 [Blastocatellia bacterium]